MAKIIMKKFKLTMLLLLVATVTFAQKSPKKIAEGTINDVSITIDYSAPSVKGRVIWGELVPYNKVWRAGANENTTFTFEDDVTIGDTLVKAGKYGFFIIPNENDDWTVILSSKNDAWGTNGYSETNDVLRLAVTPTFVTNNQEQLEYKVNEEEILMAWEKAQLAIPVN